MLQYKSAKKLLSYPKKTITGLANHIYRRKRSLDKRFII